jgi:hypothetical protein
MKPTTTILIGSPLSGDEARFLHVLCKDLENAEALILANFQTTKRQIDFVVITPTYAALLELKNFPRPIFGEQNGIWSYENAGGTRSRYAGENPWQQTKEAKFALSDEMVKYQKKQPEIPSPASRGYFTQFAAFVCIYPEIHADSRVTRGDHKVGVASYQTVLAAINSDSISSTWNLTHWRRFAKEHLSLAETTSAAATNPLIDAAITRIADYRNRLKAVIGTLLPPLFIGDKNPDYGEELINSMLERRNFILLGQSGSTKTFHMHHLVLATCSEDYEVPLLLEARKYRGPDFWTLLKSATAPFFPGDPKQLLDDIRLCGLRPLLMVDALNECASTQLPELLRGIQSFCLQFSARVVMSSQSEVSLAGEIEASVKRLLLPNAVQKRSIYAYHAGIEPTPELDHLCAGFTNAYDLTIAGRCHASTVRLESRTDLYDRYTRQSLVENSAVACALLRAIAGELARTFEMFWNRDTFERFAENFLAEEKASLTILDQIRGSRLVRVTDDSFSFEHELLSDYFNAEQLRRTFADFASLALELRKPRNQDLFELVLPRFTKAEDVAILLPVATDVKLLCIVMSGQCGHVAQSVLIDQCESLLDRALQDLSRIEVICRTTPTENGRKRFVTLEVTGNQTWSSYDARLCTVIALNIGHPRLRGKFFELFDLTEWTLRAAVHKAAKYSGFKEAPIWGEAVRLFGGVFEKVGLEMPCVSILASMRAAQMYPRHFKEGLPIRSELLERVGRTPVSHFAMLVLVEDLQHADMPGNVETNVALVQQGLNSGVYILRLSVLQLLQSMARYIDEIAPEHLPPIRQMLEAFETDQVFENALRLEALAAFGGLDLPVSLTAALSEMKSLISLGVLENSDFLAEAEAYGLSPQQMLAQKARGCLTNIFEDIFQGVYSEAYSELSDHERHRLLHLAATAEQRGFSTDWIVRELLTYGQREDLALFQHLASRPDVDTVCPQESVAVFAMGIAGCARFDDTPPPYGGEDSPVHVAWKTIGEVLFFICRAKATGSDDFRRAQSLLKTLQGDYELAVADVLYQLAHSFSLGLEIGLPDLVMSLSEEVRLICERCIRSKEPLPSVFGFAGSRDGDLIRFLSSSLGRIGNEGSVAVLQSIADDAQFGKSAIEAIEQIRRNIIR